MDVESRLAAVEQQLAELIGRSAQPPIEPLAEAPAEDDVFWALHGLTERVTDEGGAVLFTGAVDLPTGEHYEWQQGHLVQQLLADDWTATAEVLNALGHPVRLLLLRRVLEGVRTTADLAAQEELGTSGQLYHHLRQLVSAGWLRSSGRGHYSVPGDRVIPLLVIIAAARR
ncbi:ArsR family transcriptional regulator [Actinoplanes sp. NPDC051633]|uniref:ArsR family transcriptional regulator n=1 Tax=Actinoplanes sp. NPDC051633 TaxID=3155670 RepID=UPI0034358D46